MHARIKKTVSSLDVIMYLHKKIISYKGLLLFFEYNKWQNLFPEYFRKFLMISVLEAMQKRSCKTAG